MKAKNKWYSTMYDYTSLWVHDSEVLDRQRKWFHELYELKEDGFWYGTDNDGKSSDKMDSWHWIAMKKSCERSGKKIPPHVLNGKFKLSVRLEYIKVTLHTWLLVSTMIIGNKFKFKSIKKESTITG